MSHRGKLIHVGLWVGLSMNSLAFAQDEVGQGAQEAEQEAPPQPVTPAANAEEDAGSELSAEVASCVSKHEQAQVARLEGRLGDAEQALEACSSPSCPEVIEQDCQVWQREVAAAFPTFVVRARGPEGDIAAGRVLVDGEEVSSELDGEPIRVETGRHLIRVELPNGESAQKSLVFSAGEQARFLEFDFRPVPVTVPVPAAPPSLEATRPVSWLTVGLGAAALGATALTVGFGVDATVQNNKALDSCAPHCSPETSERVNRSAAIADISLAVAIVTAVGAAVSYSMRPTVYRPVESQMLPSDVVGPGGGKFALHSLKKGASLCWQGSF